MLESLLPALLIIAIALLFLCVRLFWGKRFPKTHVDSSPHLARRGIHCARTQDREARTPSPHRVAERRKDSLR